MNIHNLISKICPKFQVLSSHFFEVTKLLYEHWAKIVQSKNISTPISNVITCQSKVCVQEFWYIASGLDINFNNPRTTILYAKKLVVGCEIRRVIHHFFLWNDMNLGLSEVLSEQCLRWVTESLATWVQFPQARRRVLKPSAAPQPFCVALNPSVSALTHALFILLRSL